MIIAWGVFIISSMLCSLFLVIQIVYIFTEKLDDKREECIRLINPLFFWVIITLISAQIIWG